MGRQRLTNVPIITNNALQVQHEAHVDYRGEDGMTPLGQAVSKGAQSVVDYFFKVGTKTSYNCSFTRPIHVMVKAQCLWDAAVKINVKYRQHKRASIK